MMLKAKSQVSKCMASGKSPRNKAISILAWIYNGSCSRTNRKILDPQGGCGENILTGAKTERKKKNFKDEFAFPFFLSCMTLRKSTSQSLYYDIYTMRVIVHTE